jgi:hypothetical protein
MNDKEVMEHSKGSWIVKQEQANSNQEIQIVITKEEVQITIKDGQSVINNEVFRARGEWYGDFFKFRNTSYYFKHADVQYMVFGKQRNSPFVGSYEWEEKFIRVE